jgi:outer membrane receptor protein involved in Fe transport
MPHIKIATLLGLWLALPGLGLWAQQSLTGKITDKDSREPLEGVSIQVLEAKTGTNSDAAGAFSISIPDSTAAAYKQVSVVFSYVGYTTETLKVALPNAAPLEVRLESEPVVGQGVVVSASRVSERILDAPVSVEKMDVAAIQATPSVSFYEGLANLRGVDMVTTSLGFRTLNTRGFNGGANNRFIQRIDGMDNQAPGLNFAPGNIVGINDLDVASAELLPGAASALYGPNALNGVLDLTSKSPFDFPGLSVSLKGGMNHLDGVDADPSPYGEFALRYAQKVGQRFAFKMNFHTFRGTDWHAANYDQALDELNNAYPASRNPEGADRVNVYGDEVNDDLTLRINGRDTTMTIARTGYQEKDLVDYGVKTMKGDISLHYKVTDKAELIAQYRLGGGTTVYQGANRYSIRDFLYHQARLELRSDHYFIRAYMTMEDAGGSYDSRFSAWNMNRAWSPDDTWFTDYRSAFNGQITGVEAGSFAAARAYADRNRPLPGTQAFTDLQNRVNADTDWRTGAGFYDKTKLYQAEGQYSFGRFIKFIDLDLGGSFRVYDLNSNGTIFYDTLTIENGIERRTPIRVWEGGAYLQATKRLLDNRLRLTASLRMDAAKNYDPIFTPRFNAVFKASQNQSIRASFQTAFRYPTMQNQYIDLDLGRIRLIAGLPPIWDFYGLTNTKNYTLASFVNFALGGLNPDTLREYPLKKVQPERVQAFELGYKAILGKKLFIDANGFFNLYSNFLNNTRFVNVNIPDSIARPTAPQLVAALVSTTNPPRPFQIDNNAPGSVTNYGFAIGLDYALPRNIRLGGNYTFSDFRPSADSDPSFLWSFNTPRHKFNISVNSSNVYKNLGFGLVFRWCDSYRWEASFGNGDVPSFYTLDAQVSYRIPKWKTTLKVGGTNITNNRYFELFGGPTIGAMTYFQITYDSFY